MNHPECHKLLREELNRDHIFSSTVSRLFQNPSTRHSDLLDPEPALNIFPLELDA